MYMLYLYCTTIRKNNRDNEQSVWATNSQGDELSGQQTVKAMNCQGNK